MAQKTMLNRNMNFATTKAKDNLELRFMEHHVFYYNKQQTNQEPQSKITGLYLNQDPGWGGAEETRWVACSDWLSGLKLETLAWYEYPRISSSEKNTPPCGSRSKATFAQCDGLDLIGHEKELASGLRDMLFLSTTAESQEDSRSGKVPGRLSAL
jgi:hypothetical protein